MSPFIERRLGEAIVLALILAGYGVYEMVRWVVG